MKKLRVVQERRKNVPTEYDLRDLGRDPVLSESSPYGALIVHSPEPEKISSRAHEEGLRSEWSAEHRALVVHPAKIVDGEHKFHAVNLFSFVMKHMDVFPKGTHLHLVEVNRLAHHLEHRLKHSNTPAHHELVLKHHAHHAHKDHELLTISGHSAHHLRQAGFPIEVLGTQSVTFTTTSLSQLRGQLIRDHVSEQMQQNQKIRKVG